ncbi:MAG: DUF3343 domain-containing protein [Clostridiaceae bacterium]|nr:DUF3343 domain-containing protein [Clostridiaceae bacterium]
MDCIAIYDSGNFAFRMNRIFEQQGLFFEVISTPCRISTSGCGYCLLFPFEYLNSVVSQSVANGCPVREAYKIDKKGDRNIYIRVI